MKKRTARKTPGRKVNKKLKSPAMRKKTSPCAASRVKIIMPPEYMGKDRRSVAAIISADAAAVARAKLTNAAIAGKLAKILRRAMAAMGMVVPLPGGEYSAVCRESMGRIACPFGDGLYEKGQVEICRIGEDKPLAIISPLSVHLIARHGFYQGRGSAFRTDLKILRMLM